MAGRYLETKFHIPPERAISITRPRLLERLDVGLYQNRKLNLVSAPAGYGKTSLVAEWVRTLLKEDGRQVAWLSLDQEDNDPQRFLGYWLAALRRNDESIGQNAQSLLETSDPPLNAILSELINEAAHLTYQIILVLDDFHTIVNPELNAALEHFIEYQPLQFHLVITTRVDPTLPLARLRVRSQMTEIRAHDLRFTTEEAGQFLNQFLTLELEDEAIRVLEARTEGWAAGLQLAALALQNLPNPQNFIESFGGSHRYVLDYLAEEVIRQLGEDTSHFLTQTSVLDRFNADLCEALTGKADSEAILDRLEEANLFIIPLDHERVWYRYHHLFADYLRVGLSKTETAELYRKAASWHEANGLTFEAVRYAIASGDDTFAAGVIERAVQKAAAWSSGRLDTLSDWLNALPSMALQTRPLLSLHASRILYLLGRFKPAEKLLDQAEQYVSKASIPEPEADRLSAMAALYRGAIASMRGEVGRAFEQTERAQALLPEEERLLHARAAYSLGLAYELSGETEQAVQVYLQSSDLAEAAGVHYLGINARCSAAMAQITLGKLRQAAQTCQEAVGLSDETRIPPLGLAWSTLGAVAYEENELDAAEEYIQDGIELSRQGGLQDDLSLGLIFLARLKQAQGDLSGAAQALEQGIAILDAYGITRISNLVSAYEARLQLATGQPELALEWARQYQAQRVLQPVDYLREFEDLTLARVLLVNEETESAQAILDPLLEGAQTGNRVRTVIEALILQSLAHQISGNTPAAVDRLAQALRLAAPRGLVRVFLDESAPLVDLLAEARPIAPEFVDELLERSPAAAKAKVLSAKLSDPLTEQERRVLELVVAGKSNQEIAEELVISVGTAKWHVHNILSKLDVNNRVEAIVRAHELGLA